MDPTAALDDALNALADEKPRDALLSLASLQRWLIRDGAPPVLSRSMGLALVSALRDLARLQAR